MKNGNTLKVVLIVLLCLLGTTHATVWYVHPDSAMNTIQDGLSACTTGDTVLAGPGTYLENVIWPNTQGIDLISEYGPDTTIIDGGSAGRVITVSMGVDTTTLINGFTIQNGFAYEGGGIGCFNQSSPTITDNVIAGNRATYGGGGIECQDYSAAIIADNIIADNTCPYGGGIECANSSPTITGNMIIDNTADTTDINPIGAGILCFDYSSPNITGNTIAQNRSFWGAAGIMCHTNSHPLISGNIITDNMADSLGGGIGCYLSSPTITDNIITGNTATSGGGGIICRTSSPNIEYCTIANNNGDGVYCDMASQPNIYHNDIVGNTPYGVCNTYASITVDADSNWWGDPSGPAGFGPGIGDSVSDYVDFDPWLTSPGVGEFEITKPLTLNLQVSPNPFRHSTGIKWQISDNSQIINLEIYDVIGRLVRQWDHRTIRLSDRVSWEGTDQGARRLPSGVYFVTLRAGKYTTTEKVLLIR